MDIKTKKLVKDLSNIDDDLRALSAMTLMKLDYPEKETRREVTEELIKATLDRNVAVRFFARKALDKIKKADKMSKIGEVFEIPVEERLYSEDYRDRLSAAMEIKNKNMAEYKDKLLELIKTEEHNFVKAGMISCLKLFLNEAEADILIKYLQDSDSRVRANTIEALEHIKAQEAIPALFTALRDPDNRIRAAAAKALQSFGEEKVFGELKKMLESPEEWMKVSAIYALSHITAPESIEMLIETVKTAQQPETKIKAIIALANYYDQSTYVFLRGLEANSDGIIKETAAKAIKLIEEKFGPNPPETTILNLQDDDAQNKKAQNQGAGGEKTDDLATAVSNFFRKGKDEAIELSNRTALNFSVSDTQKEIDEQLKSIGNTVFDMYQAGDIEFFDLISIGNEILKMNFFIQKYTEQEEKTETKKETGFFAQLKNLFTASSPEQKSNANHAKKFNKRKDELLVKMGKLTVKKYESKEFTPQILEAPYLIYEKLFKKLEEQKKKLG